MNHTEQIKVQIMNLLKTANDDALLGLIRTAEKWPNYIGPRQVSEHHFYFESSKLLVELNWTKPGSGVDGLRNVVVSEVEPSKVPRDAIKFFEQYLQLTCESRFYISSNGELNIVRDRNAYRISEDFKIQSQKVIDTSASINLVTGEVKYWASDTSGIINLNPLESLYVDRFNDSRSSLITKDILETIESICKTNPAFKDAARKYNLSYIIGSDHSAAIRTLLLGIKFPAIRCLLKDDYWCDVVMNSVYKIKKIEDAGMYFDLEKDTALDVLGLNPKFEAYYKTLNSSSINTYRHLIRKTLDYLERLDANLTSDSLLYLSDIAGYEFYRGTKHLGYVCFLLKQGRSLEQIKTILEKIDEVECMNPVGSLPLIYQTVRYEYMTKPGYNGSLPGYVTIRSRQIGREVDKKLHESYKAVDKVYLDQLNERTKHLWGDSIAPIDETWINRISEGCRKELIDEMSNGMDALFFIKKSKQPVVIYLVGDVLVGSSERLSESQIKRLDTWGQKHGILVPPEVNVLVMFNDFI